MAGSQQKSWLTDTLESLPSIVFLVAWRGGGDIAFAGWLGAASALALLLGFRFYRMPFNPILLGINLHLAAITPLIVASFHLGVTDLARLLLRSSESGVLISVFLTGCLLTLFSGRGFVGDATMPRRLRLQFSASLLAVTAALIPWSFAHAGQTLVSLAVPFMILFALRRFLIARWHDKAGGNSSAFAGLAMPAGETH
ncbi:hypothetical protein [Oceanibaculum nanhaiense]|uniref:hypothetical protein n=1 Tax=Oceanibaculum nanhaiense TaxID=1909734 RepID=UPI00396DB169